MPGLRIPRGLYDGQDLGGANAGLAVEHRDPVRRQPRQPLPGGRCVPAHTGGPEERITAARHLQQHSAAQAQLDAAEAAAAAFGNRATVSSAARLVDAGVLTEAQMQDHPKRSELRSALGLAPEQLVVTGDDGSGPVQPGDVFSADLLATLDRSAVLVVLLFGIVEFSLIMMVHNVMEGATAISSRRT